MLFAGTVQVKNKIKRVDRLPGDASLHRDIHLSFKGIILVILQVAGVLALLLGSSMSPTLTGRRNLFLTNLSLSCRHPAIRII
jgi:hypothetical protein